MPSFISFRRRANAIVGMNSKAPPDHEPEVTPLDLIFACSICGDTFSDLYQGHHADSVQGLSDGINARHRVVTRLYIASCCHAICIKHIENGNGPAFHQEGQQPQATCPVCVKENNDHAPRPLFSVRGFNEEEHHPAIPQFWFQAPPMKLDAKDKEMEAMRFQYLALIRYSKNITTAHKQLLKINEEGNAKLQSMQDLASEEHAKTLKLEQELERLRPLEREARKLHRLEARLPAIEHYLKLIPKLTEQHDMMQQRLISLGYAPTLDRIPPFDGDFPDNINDDMLEADGDHAQAVYRSTDSSDEGGGNIHRAGVAEVEEPPASSRRPLKRSRLHSPQHQHHMHAAPSSRDMMPPPSKPLSRMKSIRKMIPSIRNKFSHGRLAPPRAQRDEVDSDVQMENNNDHWEEVNHHGRLHTLEDPRKRETQCISSSEDGRRLPNRNRHHESNLHNADFTFEAPSQIKLKGQRSANLPSEPSYIRLLDGLDRNSDLELELDDPRSRARIEPAPVPFERNQYQNGKRRNVANNGNGTCNMVYPVTPAPRRVQQRVNDVDGVVSPFFGDRVQGSQPFSRAQFAEPEASLSHSGNYHSRRPMSPEAMDWHEPRSLNGLSFFDSPVNVRNEPIGWMRERRQVEHMAPVSPNREKRMGLQAFFSKSGRSSSRIQHHDRYDTSDSSRPRQTHTQLQFEIPYSSSSHQLSHSRVTRLPSAMPSRVPEHLGSAGVRNGQSRRPTLSRNTFASPIKASYSGSRRRFVQR